MLILNDDYDAIYEFHFMFNIKLNHLGQQRCPIEDDPIFDIPVLCRFSEYETHEQLLINFRP